MIMDEKNVLLETEYVMKRWQVWLLVLVIVWGAFFAAIGMGFVAASILG